MKTPQNGYRAEELGKFLTLYFQPLTKPVHQCVNGFWHWLIP